MDRFALELDEDTRSLIERAADLERREVSDYCLAALAEAARQTIAEHEGLVLSARDRAVFFNALIDPPEPPGRLIRALSEHARRIAS